MWGTNNLFCTIPDPNASPVLILILLLIIMILVFFFMLCFFFRSSCDTGSIYIFFLVVSRSGQQLINNKSRATGVKCATRSNTNNNELIIMNFCFMYRYQPRCVFSHFLFCLRVSSIFFLIISINLINSKK